MLRWRTDRIQIKIPPSFTTMLHKLTYLHNFWKHFITARKQSLQRLCFHRCLSVHSGVCPIACWDTPHWADTLLGRHPPAQTPSWADTPLGRHPLGRHPPGQTPPSCAVHAGMWSTSGRYASHWNAFLLILC